jgi:hypothetical protein
MVLFQSSYLFHKTPYIIYVNDYPSLTIFSNKKGAGIKKQVPTIKDVYSMYYFKTHVGEATTFYASSLTQQDEQFPIAHRWGLIIHVVTLWL